MMVPAGLNLVRLKGLGLAKPPRGFVCVESLPWEPNHWAVRLGFRLAWCPACRLHLHPASGHKDDPCSWCAPHHLGVVAVWVNAGIVVTPFPNEPTREMLEFHGAEHIRKTGRIIDAIDLVGCQSPIENGRYAKRRERWVRVEAFPQEPDQHRFELLGAPVMDVECECGRRQTIAKTVTFTTCWHCGVSYRKDGLRWYPAEPLPEHQALSSGALGTPHRDAEPQKAAESRAVAPIEKPRAFAKTMAKTATKSHAPSRSDRAVRKQLSEARGAGRIGRKS